MRFIRNSVLRASALRTHLRWLTPAIALWVAGCASAGTAVLVEDGVPGEAIQPSERWETRHDRLVGSGTGHMLAPSLRIGTGDCTIAVRLSLDALEGTAASFVIDGNSHFGFDSRGDQIFVEGPLFGGSTRSIARASEHITADELFELVVQRRGDTIRIAINGEVIHEQEDGRPAMGRVALRPHRATMRIADWRMRGNLVEAYTPRDAQPWTLPAIDLSRDTDRQSVVDREPGQYLGHPTTVLLDDGRTIIAVYPKGHGRGAIVLRRSTDGGVTWGEREDVPESWATSKETPTIFPVRDAEGQIERLIMFSGSQGHYGDLPVRLAVGDPEGRSWTELEDIPPRRGIVAMSAMIRQRDSGDLIGWYHDGTGTLYASRSADDGLTWSEQWEVFPPHRAGAFLCEPGVVRSPDGTQLAMLLRENSRQFNSFITFSDDEGETWSDPVEMPSSLTGDRHVCEYAPDGRLVITFRDKAKPALTQTEGHYVAWVGTYDDLVQGNEGQYRVKLIHNYRGSDCGYSGVEVLADGTFVCTTYAGYIRGEDNLVVSTRFTLDELDTKAAELPQQTDVFVRGEGGYHTFRIPAVIRAANGDLLAFAEGRVNHGGDSGDIDTVMKRSTDGGATWGELQLVGDFGTGCVGNPAPVVDAASGNIILLGVLQPDGSHEGDIRNNRGGYRDPCLMRSTDHGQTWSEPVSLFESCDREDWRWYATGPCHGIQLEHGEHAGRMVVPANFSVVGSGGNDRLGAHALYSDDGGQTWQIGAVDDSHVGNNELNPNESTVVELADGRLMFNCRDQGGTSRATRAVTFSDDGGESFTRPYAVEEELVAPVCQAALLGVDTDAGRLIVYSGPGVWDSRSRMQLCYTTDAGETWQEGPVLYPGSAAYSDLVEIDSSSIGCLYEADGYGRIVFARVPLSALDTEE